jgi:hypothetical protein
LEFTGSQNIRRIHVAKQSSPDIGHNSNGGDTELTDDQRAALLFQHVRSYKTALEAKKKADADIKNICKIAKAECGKDAVESIKDKIKMETEEGQAEVKAQIERQLRVARWMGADVGTQFSMNLEVDRTPAEDRAYDDGKRVGLAGGPCNPPHDPSVPQYAKWMGGFHAGQAVLAAGIKRKEPEPEADKPKRGRPRKDKGNGEASAIAH